jgi:hypothetical protein
MATERGSGDAVNQCMGCQAGWPLIEEPRAMRLGPPLRVHRVVGGYEEPWVERVVCTRDRYEQSREDQ